jgi:glycosyltransferase involved in cell wall biosynthesis
MKKLIVYNLETNLDSPVLAATHDWLVSFADHFDEVTVYSTHVGRHNLPHNVKVVELGGGSATKRLIAIGRLSRSFLVSIPKRKQLLVFHHMSTRTLLILGPLYRLLQVKQILWYSHSKKSMSLRFSLGYANKIFTSTQGAFPFNSRNLKYIGHGIQTQRFREAYRNSKVVRRDAIALGRVAKIKKIEEAIHAIAQLEFSKIRLICVGNQDADLSYTTDLTKMSQESKVEILFKGAINYSQIPSELANYEYVYTGTPGSVDKAVIEGACAGCFVITSEESALQITGMAKIWVQLGHKDIPDLANQFKILSNLGEEEKERLRLRLSEYACSANDISQTTKTIMQELDLL